MPESCSNAVFILGMHRSGTSCLAGTLESAGLVLGDVVTYAPFNKKGNRESLSVMALNNKVLAFNDATWNAPKAIVDWLEEHKIERDAIISEYQQNGNSLWGIKDPRFCFTLPFWLDAGWRPNFIASYRHPYAVAKSLQNRNQFELATSYQIWTQYNQNLLDIIDKYGCELISFDVEQSAYLQRVAKVCEKVGLKLDLSSELFFSSDLRNHYDEAEHIELPANTLAVYERLKAVYAEQCSRA